MRVVDKERRECGYIVAPMGLQRFERRLERLVEGAFNKVSRSDLQPVEIGRRLVREVDAFVDGIAGALQTRQPSAGLGEDVRLRGERVIGSGLELDGEVIQLSAFTSRDGGRRAFGRIARPSARR